MTYSQTQLPMLSKHSTRELLAMRERVTKRIRSDEEYYQERARELEDLKMFKTLIVQELERRH